MRKFIFIKQLETKTIDKKEKQIKIKRKTIPVDKIDSITETSTRINFSELETSCKSRYKQKDIDDAIISKIVLKETDKESNTDTIYVIGRPDDFCDYLNS